MLPIAIGITRHLSIYFKLDIDLLEPQRLKGDTKEHEEKYLNAVNCKLVN